ncbi:hypothetical protein GC167_08580 [bacterium]|nr:hypothetical protein [bacterium]
MSSDWRKPEREREWLRQFEERTAQLAYHNREHVEHVRDWALKLAEREGWNSESMDRLRCAAVFHDWSYPDGAFEHEERSAQFLETLLSAETELSRADITSMADAIRATRIPQSPKDALGRLLCDADLAYLGTELYGPWSERLRIEWSVQGRSFLDAEWMALQIVFLTNHRYHSEAAQFWLEPVKQAHLDRLRAGFFSTFGTNPPDQPH